MQTMQTMQTDSPCALQVIDLHQRFGLSHILCGLSFGVPQGMRLGIVGPNGAGKSTLFNLISGRCRPNSGQIWLNGCRIDGKTPRTIKQMGLSRSFQISHFFPNLSVFDHLRCAVLFGLGHSWGIRSLLSHPHDLGDRVCALMARVQLDGQRDTLAMHLCHADQRALELALTLASDAAVVLLDEPTAGMCTSESDRMVRLIRTVTAGKTLLIIEHDMDVVLGLADHIAVMVNGQLQAFDTADAIRANTDVQRSYGCLPLGPI